MNKEQGIAIETATCNAEDNLYRWVIMVVAIWAVIMVVVAYALIAQLDQKVSRIEKQLAQTHEKNH